MIATKPDAAPIARVIELTPKHREVLRLFRMGRDTVDISKWIGSDEARAYNLLAEAREAGRAR